MFDTILLKIETEQKVSAIKEIRSVLGWGLYEAKEGLENGIIFNNSGTMHAFMKRVTKGMEGSTWKPTTPTFVVTPFVRGGVPQDASNITIWP